MDDHLTTYWNNRYQGGAIWGDTPCPSAYMALRHMQQFNLSSILVPGCGYGRNSLLFANHGFHVTAFDISDVAIQYAKQQAQQENAVVQYGVADVLNLPTYLHQSFDGIYLSNVLHLFLKGDRDELIQSLANMLRKDGILAFSCISTYDRTNFGAGIEIEPNTYMKHHGKSLHFFDKKELDEILNPQFEILEKSIHIQTETDPNGEEEDLYLWYVAAKKV